MKYLRLKQEWVDHRVNHLNLKPFLHHFYLCLALRARDIPPSSLYVMPVAVAQSPPGATRIDTNWAELFAY